MWVGFKGIADAWKMGLVKHVYYEVAHGDHIIPPAGWSEIKLVQAGEHNVATESLNFFLVGMLTRLLIYDASGKAIVY